MSTETLNTIVAMIATFIGTLLIVLRSASNQRQNLATTTKQTISTEFDKLQSALYRTFTDTLAIKDNLIADDRKEIANLKSDLANYKELLDSTLREVDNMRSDMRGMRAEHDQRIREMQIQIDGLLKESAEKDRQLNALTRAVQEREDMIGGQVQKLDRFERALSEKDAALVEAQATIGNLKQNEQRTADELNQLRERVRNLESKVSELQAERGVLLAERDAARAEVLRVNTEKSALLARIDTLETQLRLMHAVKLESTPLNERAQAVIADMKAEGYERTEAGA